MKINDTNSEDIVMWEMTAGEIWRARYSRIDLSPNPSITYYYIKYFADIIITASIIFLLN